MLLSAAGPWGPFLLVALVLGLPIQFAVASMVAFGRRVPAALAVAAPAAALIVGGLAVIQGVDEAVAAVGTAADPAWVPWFALQDRARVGGPAIVAGAGALALTLPPLMGAVVRALRAARRRWLAPVVGVGVAALAALGAAAFGTSTGEAGRGLLSALTILVLGGAASLAGLDAAPRRMTASGIAGACFAVGAIALIVAELGGAWYDGLRALPDFDAVWSRVGALDAHEADVAYVLPSVVPFLAVAGIGVLPSILVQRLRGLDARSGMDVAGFSGVVLVIVLVWGWVPFRWRILSHLAGDHAAAVLEERRGYDVPHRALVPPRVLVADPKGPRWVLMREAGGVEVADVVGDLEAAAATLQLGDGLVLPPEMIMEDVYFHLADARAGAVALVGCGDVTGAVWNALEADPLRAVGRCGGYPVRLRVDDDLQHPRKLIVLKDRLLDDGGDIVPIKEVADVKDRAVIVRAQVDARVADVVALLGRLADAGPVYLGWGVTLDGDDLPVGVNPGIRIRLRPPSPNGQEAPAPAPL